MYNKYVRLREEKPSRMKNPKTFETLDACRWGSSCDLAITRYRVKGDAFLSNLSTPRRATISNPGWYRSNYQGCTPASRIEQRRETTPVWWNGIHSRLKICRLTLMGSNPITGTKFSCVYKVEFGTMRQDGCTLDRGRNCMREGCNTAKAD